MPCGNRLGMQELVGKDFEDVVTLGQCRGKDQAGKGKHKDSSGRSGALEERRGSTGNEKTETALA